MKGAYYGSGASACLPITCCCYRSEVTSSVKRISSKRINQNAAGLRVRFIERDARSPADLCGSLGYVWSEVVRPAHRRTETGVFTRNSACGRLGWGVEAVAAVGQCQVMNRLPLVGTRHRGALRAPDDTCMKITPEWGFGTCNQNQLGCSVTTLPASPLTGSNGTPVGLMPHSTPA